MAVLVNIMRQSCCVGHPRVLAAVLIRLKSSCVVNDVWSINELRCGSLRNNDLLLFSLDHFLCVGGFHKFSRPKMSGYDTMAPFANYKIHVNFGMFHLLSKIV